MSEHSDETPKTEESFIPPVSGKPNVAGKRRRNRAGGLFLALLALALILGGIFMYWAFIKSNGDGDEAAAQQQAQPSLTSSRELSLPPMPPAEPEPEIKEQPEPAAEEKEPEKEVQPQVIVQQVPAPLPMTQGGFDEHGNPIPTLEELKFAAPMMGKQGSAQTASDDSAALSSSSALQDDGSYEGRDLSQRLRSVPTPSQSASRIQNRSLILSKGTVIECILESRVDTTVPGMTSCVIPRDIYSMNGRVLLVEKGTKAIGEYQGSVANGLARIFMLWTELRTPHGVSIQLNSPAADALGGAGMGGYVDFHWWKRFGNALLFSMISDGFQYVINSANSNNNNGDVTYENTEDGMDEIIREAMRQSGNIPPTLIKNQGERVSIFVARDLSFENVYEIKAHGK